MFTVPNMAMMRARTSSLVGVLPTLYKCKDCDYEGHLVFEIEPEEDSDKEDP